MTNTPATITPAVAAAVQIAKYGWENHGCCPLAAVVENWGVPLAARWVVILQYACIRGAQHLYLDECATESAAMALCIAINATI